MCKDNSKMKEKQSDVKQKETHYDKQWPWENLDREPSLNQRLAEEQMLVL